LLTLGGQQFALYKQLERFKRKPHNLGASTGGTLHPCGEKPMPKLQHGRKRGSSQMRGDNM